MRRFPSWFILFLCVLAPSAARAAAGLVADLRPAPLPPGNGGPYRLTPSPSALFFAAFDSYAGVELWASGGSEATTRRVADLCPGPCDSRPDSLVVAGDLVFFLAYEPAHGYELWRSDGTASGTVLLLDAAPGPPSGAYGAFLAVGRRLFFTVGKTLWVSDGRPGGTRRIGDFAGTFLAGVGETAFFVFDDGVHGQELWKSDGTPQGTAMVRDIAPGAVSALSAGELNISAAAAGRWLLFPAFDPAHGTELWRSDGSARGTRLVRDLAPGADSSGPWRLTPAQGGVYFTVAQRLWWSDGTPGGTVALTPHGVVPDITPPGVSGSALFFPVEGEDGGAALWRADGPSREARLLRQFPAPSEGGRTLLGAFAPLTRGVAFAVNDGQATLWRSDGTPAGTIAVAPLVQAFGFVSFRGKAYFDSTDERGAELWQSDGTAAGTRRLVDLEAGDRSSSPASLTAVGEALFFLADDGVHGRELWRSDGTRAGTSMLTDGPPSPPGFDASPRILGEASGRLLFAASAGDLLAADGESGEVTVVAPAVGKLGAARRVGSDWLFFAAQVEGEEWVVSLWRSDGWSAAAVAEVLRGPTEGPFGPEGPPQINELAVQGGTLFFTAEGLWRSDGTPLGTVRVLVDPCGGCDAFHDLVATPTRLYFATFEIGERVRESVWTSDGTPAGTRALRVVLDASPIEWSARQAPGIGHLATAGERLVFSGDDGASGAEPWTSDGTAAGTRRLRDARPGPAGSFPESFVAASGGLFFAADDGVAGRELWWSDGTSAGTRRVADLRTDAAPSFPQQITAIDGIVVFAALDDAHGLEVWRSDGTSQGTRRVADLALGPVSSAPRTFTRAGDTLFFVAGRPRNGYELFSLPLGDLE